MLILTNECFLHLIICPIFGERIAFSVTFKQLVPHGRFVHLVKGTLGLHGSLQEFFGREEILCQVLLLVLLNISYCEVVISELHFFLFLILRWSLLPFPVLSTRISCVHTQVMNFMLLSSLNRHLVTFQLDLYEKPQ